MKQLVLTTLLPAVFFCNFARAEDAKPEHEFTFNAAAVSDYRYRGISQSRLQPALQGGADYTNNPSGWYLGTWLSTIKWTKDAGGGGNVEIDLYGGKRGQLTKDVSTDVGILSYLYPSNGLMPRAETTELYAQLGYGPAYVKYSLALTNLFGFDNSKRSGYVDIGANIDVGNGFTVNLHAGHQSVKNNPDSAYTDWKLGVTKDFGAASVALAVIGADNNTYIGPLPDGKNLAKSALQLMVSKTF